MLEPHDQVPHFVVTELDGRTVTYAAIWQHAHLVLVSLGNETAMEDRERLEAYIHRVRAFAAGDVACVVTRDTVPGLVAPGVLVADRWGEIAYIAGAADDIESFPSPDALAEWIEYLRSRCPECEGEAR